MKLKAKAKESLYYGLGMLNFSMLLGRDFLMVLAMPRSGSTLLTHILEENRSIDGIGETKTTYRSNRDLVRMAGKIRAMQWRYKLARERHARYLMDKVVHNHLLPPEFSHFLAGERFKTIFLIREPAGTAASLVRVMDHMSERQALDIYINRARALAEIAANLGRAERECFFLDHRQLVGCTRPVLDGLQVYLELPEPLREQYQVTSLTGRFGVGDKSDEISAGRVLKPKNKPARPAVDLPADLLARARVAYRECAAAMRSSCLHVNEADCPAGSAPAAA
jgi:hypothetical protein